MSGKSDFLKAEMLLFIQAAIDLANSVQADITAGEEISAETVLELSRFKERHDLLSNASDVMNGVN